MFINTQSYYLTCTLLLSHVQWTYSETWCNMLLSQNLTCNSFISTAWIYEQRFDSVFWVIILRTDRTVTEELVFGGDNLLVRTMIKLTVCLSVTAMWVIRQMAKINIDRVFGRNRWISLVAVAIQMRGKGISNWSDSIVYGSYVS